MPAFLLPLLLNRYTIGGVLALGLLLGAYMKGYMAASAKCHDAELRYKIASLERDIAASKAADEIEKMLQGDIERENLDLQKKVQDYEAELATRPDNRCVLSPADAAAINGLHGGGGR